MQPVPARTRPTFGLAAGGLTKLFGETAALWQVDLRATSRDVIAIHGPNGSGKSTLLRVLAGLTATTRGSVAWTAPAGAGPPRIAFVGHDSHLYEALTPLENLHLAARLAHADADRIPVLIDRLGLVEAAAVQCQRLSAGTLRRVAIARATAIDPDVLLIDEPFAAQDRAAATLASTLLTELADEGRLVIVASHDDARSQAIATRIVTLDGGRIVGTDAEPASKERVR